MVNMINIEVIYALPDVAICKELSVANNTSVGDAIRQSGILEQYPEIDLKQNRVGIFSELKSLEDKVSEGDRIEIYRSLKIDPKEARRQRANK